MEETKKYANGKPVDIPEDKTEREIAIKEWAEGNPNLEDAIRKCIENEIKTIACCAGHERRDYIPYLAMEIDDETIKKLYSILNSVFQSRRGIKGIAVINDIDEKGNPRRNLAIYAKPRQKDEIFKLISKGAQSEIDLDTCSPIIQRMMEIELGAFRKKLELHIVRFDYIGPLKAIELANDTLEDHKSIYDRAGITHSINRCLTDSQAINILTKISKAFGIQPARISKSPGFFERIRLSLIDRLEQDLSSVEGTYVSYSFTLKKRLLEILKAVGKKQLTEGSHRGTEQTPPKKSWVLTDEEKKVANMRNPKKKVEKIQNAEVELDTEEGRK